MKENQGGIKTILSPSSNSSYINGGDAPDGGLNTMEKEIFETRTARIWFEEGITIINFKVGAEVTMVDVKENYAIHKQLNGGGRSPIFADIAGLKFVDREGREYGAGEEVSQIVQAAAFLVSSPITKMIGSFFIGLNKPPFPTRLFTSQDEAIKWLTEFLE